MGDEAVTGGPWVMDRRRFLGFGVGAAGFVVALRWPGRVGAGAWALPADTSLVSDPTLVAALVRPDDQVDLVLSFFNLTLSGNELVSDGLGPPAMKLTLGPQHAAEESIVSGDPAPVATETMALRAAGETAVVFAVTPSPTIPFTVDTLLDLAGVALVLDARVMPPGSDDTLPPADDVTAIELPEDVFLSPESDGRFAADRSAPTIGDVTQVWRLRLGRDDGGGFVPAGETDPVNLRAFYGGVHGDDFVRVLDDIDRANLVQATTDYDGALYPDHEPLQATRLWLMLPGAHAELSGAWNPPGDLGAYTNSVSGGRDLRVTVTDRGYLLPFGHQASVLTFAERQWQTAGDGTTVAVQVLTESFVLGASTVEFGDGAPYMPSAGRQLPFRSVRLVAPGTPVTRGQIAWVDENGVSKSVLIDNAFQLVDAVTLAPLLVEYVAEDAAGQDVTFHCPTFFIRADVAFKQDGVVNTKLRALFNDHGADALAVRTLDLGGQPLAFADEVVPGDGSTTKATTELLLSLQRPVGATDDDLLVAGRPAYYPALETALVEDATLGALRSDESAPLEVTIDQQYLDHGNGTENTGTAFLRLSDRTSVAFGGDAGGLVAPNLNVDVFGQDLGISVDLSGLTQWDPLDAIGDASLLGIISLADIIDSIDITGGLDVPGLPAYTVDLLPLPTAPTEACFSFEWNPAVKSLSLLGTRVFVIADDFEAENLTNPFTQPTAARFFAQTCVGLTGAASSDTEVEVTLERFALQFPPGAPALAVKFTSLSYTFENGVADYDFDIAEYQFVGILSLLEPFRDFLQGGGNAARPIVIDPNLGTTVDLPISPPDFNLGLAYVSNVSVNIGLFIPIPDKTTEKFRVSFSVGTASDPVAISVCLFHGTASFEIDLEPPPSGIARLSASLGLGAELQASGLGVSGGIGAEVSASITYTEHADGSADIVIGGELRVYGYINIWGLAGVSVEGEIDLKYVLDTEIIRAHGSLTGSVLVLGFEKDWVLEVSEDFDVGSNGRRLAAGVRAARLAAGVDPGSFGDVYTSSDWTTYCKAFS